LNIRDWREMRKVEILELGSVDGKVKTVPTGEIGYFHQFGTDHEGYKAGPGNFPAAIVEMPDGSIRLEYAKFIKFLNPIEQADESNEANLPQKFAEKGILIAKDVKVFGRPVFEYNRGQLISIIGMMVDGERRREEIEDASKEFESDLRELGWLGIP